MQRFAVFFILCSILVLLCTAEPQNNIGEDERAIRATDAVTLRAAQDKNPDAAAANYADDATWLPPNGPMVKGRDGIRAGWAQMVALPAFTIDWQLGPILFLAIPARVLIGSAHAWQEIAKMLVR